MSSSTPASLSSSSAAQLVWALVIAGFLVLAANSASIMKKSPSEGKEEPECPGRQPCGWMVYNKSTRNTVFFMNNTCICTGEKHCIQTDDDLSVGAYVYRCIERKENNPTLIPS